MSICCDRCRTVDCALRKGVEECAAFEQIVVYTVNTPEEFPAMIDWILSEDD